MQAQLTRSTVAEEANVAEIQRLASSAAEMQAELAFRPTCADIDDLTAVITQLRADIVTIKDQKPTLDKCVETSFEEQKTRTESDSENIDTGKISAEIDEMFRLDFEDEDDETDSGTTEINRDDRVAVIEDVTADVSATGEFVRLGDEARLQVTMANGSLHALEEELVRAKESWAEVSAERARLAEQLACMQAKPALRLRASYIAALAVPIFAAMLYYLFLPHVS